MTFSRSPGWSSMTAHSAPGRRRVGTVVEAAGLPRRRAVPRVADGGDRCCPQPGRCFCGAMGDALWPEGKWRDDQISEYPDRLGCVAGFAKAANAAPPPSAWQLGPRPLFSIASRGNAGGPAANQNRARYLAAPRSPRDGPPEADRVEGLPGCAPSSPVEAGLSAPREGALSARCKSVPEPVAGSVIEGNCVAVRRGGEQPEVNRQSVG